MAKLKVSIEEVGNSSSVKIVVSNDVGIDVIVSGMKELFEIEMMSADILVGDKFSSVSIITNNKEKCEIIMKGMARTFRDLSGLNNFNQN